MELRLQPAKIEAIEAIELDSRTEIGNWDWNWDWSWDWSWNWNLDSHFDSLFSFPHKAHGGKSGVKPNSFSQASPNETSNGQRLASSPLEASRSLPKPSTCLWRIASLCEPESLRVSEIELIIWARKCPSSSKCLLPLS